LTGRVLIAKPGLDGHDRGAMLVALVLRDAGVEVIYAGLRQTPDMIVNAAISEDVAVIGLSVLTGGHVGLTKKVTEKLRVAGVQDIAVVVGGVIPAEDVPVLLEMGAAAVYPSTTPLNDIVEGIRDLTSART
jgi:methylmalonyl-CoA mutase C-terminal domain/subunit